MNSLIMMLEYPFTTESKSKGHLLNIKKIFVPKMLSMSRNKLLEIQLNFRKNRIVKTL